MLKKLIWKQYYESFRGYFVDSKTGAKKSKAKTISTFILFSSLMIFLCFCFVGMAFTVSPLLNSDYNWLYYFVFATVSIALGVFAGANNASNALFKPKDNDLLLSMPINPLTVLLSRIALVYGLCLLYVSIVWIPGCVFSFVFVGFNVYICILDFFLLLFIALFTSVISCAVGFLITIVTNKTKNKSFVTVLLSLLFLSAYYLLCFRLTNIMESLVNNAENIAKTLSVWGNILFIFAKAASGDTISFFLTTVFVSLLSYLCFYILQKNFYSLVTKAKNIGVDKTKIEYKSHNNVLKILLRKEFKHFSSSPTYMLNCGLGVVFVLLLGVSITIKRDEISELLSLLAYYDYTYYCFVPLIIVGSICLIISLNAIAVPSISLEGKNLWILKTLPVKELEILNAKKIMQLIINGLPSLITVIVISLALNINYNQMIYMFVIVLLFVEIHSSLCVILSLINPSFNWTSEVQPIKQNLNILLEMVLSIIIIMTIVAGYYFFRNALEIDYYLQYLTIIMIVIEILFRRIINTWAIRKFHSL